MKSCWASWLELVWRVTHSSGLEVIWQTECNSFDLKIQSPWLEELVMYPKAPYCDHFCSQYMFETFPSKPAFVKLANLQMTLPYIPLLSTFQKLTHWASTQQWFCRIKYQVGWGNKIHLNAIKCCVVLFGSRPALSQSPRLRVTLDGRDLLQIQKVKYPGVVFDSHLSWNDHIEGLRSKTNRIVKMLRRLHQFVPPKAVQKLYSSLVLSALDYCDVVWDGR